MAPPRGRTQSPVFTLATSFASLLTLVTLAALTNLLTLFVITCVASPGGVSVQGEGSGRTGVGYVKVATTFPTSLSNCKLKEERLKHKTHAACSALCNSTPDCTIYCMKDNVCSLYKARVTQSWAGDASASEANTFASCYSSWAYRDISHLTTATATSYYGARYPSHAIDGYYCYSFQSTYCTSIYGGHALKIELPESMAISVVRVQSWSNTVLPEVFFGNSSVYSENLKIATTSETALDASYSFSVTPPEGMEAKFLFFRSLSSYLHVCEIAIIPV
ncbi:uncharacterized protein LOC122250517 [Penaeus japonicus]|uniref:uncharacterized protein LOC122250517 n=1 Tax=Penaeus japonicus TaxID=27405 RepID=UPI001C714AD3|nr:uncharacterized protein LOC122250517 [Penaeus japonicus]